MVLFVYFGGTGHALAAVLLIIVLFCLNACYGVSTHVLKFIQFAYNNIKNTKLKVGPWILTKKYKTTNTQNVYNF